MKDLLHLLLRVSFSDLPANAQILLAGAGTGAEARFLAPLFPGWRFTLVDPAPGMLAVAERHARAGGFAERCVFHEGYIASLPMEAHDAAASRGEDPAEHKSGFREIFGTRVAAHDPAEVEALITNAGFTDLVPCYQAVLIRAWCARRA